MHRLTPDIISEQALLSDSGTRLFLQIVLQKEVHEKLPKGQSYTTWNKRLRLLEQFILTTVTIDELAQQEGVTRQALDQNLKGTLRYLWHNSPWNIKAEFPLKLLNLKRTGLAAQARTVEFLRSISTQIQAATTRQEALDILGWQEKDLINARQRLQKYGFDLPKILLQKENPLLQALYVQLQEVQTQAELDQVLAKADFSLMYLDRNQPQPILVPFPKIIPELSYSGADALVTATAFSKAHVLWGKIAHRKPQGKPIQNYYFIHRSSLEKAREVMQQLADAGEYQINLTVLGPVPEEIPSTSEIQTAEYSSVSKLLSRLGIQFPYKKMKLLDFLDSTLPAPIYVYLNTYNNRAYRYHLQDEATLSEYLLERAQQIGLSTNR